MVLLVMLLLISFGLCFGAAYAYMNNFSKNKSMEVSSYLKLFFPFVFANSNMILLSLLFEVLDIGDSRHREVIWGAVNVEFTFLAYYVIPLMLIHEVFKSKEKMVYAPIAFLAYLVISNIVGKLLKWVIELSPNAGFFDNYTFFNVYYSSNPLMEYLTLLGSLLTASFAGYGEIQTLANCIIYPFLPSQLTQIQVKLKQKMEKTTEEISAKQNEVDSMPSKSQSDLKALDKLKACHSETEQQLSIWKEKATAMASKSFLSKAFSQIMGAYAVIHLFITFYFLFFSDYFDYAMMINKKRNNYIDNILLTTFSFMGSEPYEAIPRNVNFVRVERYLSLGVVAMQLVSGMSSFPRNVVIIATKLLTKVRLTVSADMQVMIMAYCITLFYVVSSVFVIFTLPLPYRSKIKDMYDGLDFALLCYFYDKTYFVCWICFGIFEGAIYMTHLKESDKEKSN